eukprot:GHVU01161705.1.p1 GENE.GHVU01161705.1~~GHVU01161705.1.p1  ORF type:complete len:152 (+),score=0.43 GHVU01161705.1:2-457(+)
MYDVPGRSQGRRSGNLHESRGVEGMTAHIHMHVCWRVLCVCVCVFACTVCVCVLVCTVCTRVLYVCVFCVLCDACFVYCVYACLCMRVVCTVCMFNVCMHVCVYTYVSMSVCLCGHLRTKETPNDIRDVGLKEQHCFSPGTHSRMHTRTHL